MTRDTKWLALENLSTTMISEFWWKLLQWQNPLRCKTKKRTTAKIISLHEEQTQQSNITTFLRQRAWLLLLCPTHCGLKASSDEWNQFRPKDKRVCFLFCRLHQPGRFNLWKESVRNWIERIYGSIMKKWFSIRGPEATNKLQPISTERRSEKDFKLF